MQVVAGARQHINRIKARQCRTGGDTGQTEKRDLLQAEMMIESK